MLVRRERSRHFHEDGLVFILFVATSQSLELRIPLGNTYPVAQSDLTAAAADVALPKAEYGAEDFDEFHSPMLGITACSYQAKESLVGISGG